MASKLKNVSGIFTQVNSLKVLNLLGTQLIPCQDHSRQFIVPCSDGFYSELADSSHLLCKEFKAQRYNFSFGVRHPHSVGFSFQVIMTFISSSSKCLPTSHKKQFSFEHLHSDQPTLLPVIIMRRDESYLSPCFMRKRKTMEQPKTPWGCSLEWLHNSLQNQYYVI